MGLSSDHSSDPFNRDEIRRALKEEMIPRLRVIMDRAVEHPELLEWALDHPTLGQKCIMIDVEILQAISYVLAFFEPDEQG